MRHSIFAVILLLGLGLLAGVVRADDAADLAKKLAGGDAGERDKADRDLRKLGFDAVKALRDVKPEGEDATKRVRGTLTDIVIDHSKIDPEHANTAHEVAREEGKGKRYGNAERLYRHAEQLFDKLKDYADTRKDKVKQKDYETKRRICDRMKDKAINKAKGRSTTGVDLGFVKVGKENDMSDDWE